jgi:hypothetical protein
LQITLSALAFAIQLTQLSHARADGALRFAQLIGCFFTVGLGRAKFLLQGLQTLLERIQLRLLAINLIGADDQGPA